MLTRHRVIGYLAVAVLAMGASLALSGRADAAGRHPVGSIPGSAFLQPADLGGATPTTPDADLRPYLRPPLPGATGGCHRTGRYDSQALRRAEGTVSVTYPVGPTTPTVLIEYLATYRGNGAHEYLSELSRALDRGRTDQVGRWTVLRHGTAGPQSLLIRLRERIQDFGGNWVDKDTYLIAARTGRTVVVLADIGWESGSGHPAVVQQLMPAALRRAGTIR